MNPPSHTRFIVGCITLLSMAAVGTGAYLLLKGFQSGELLAQMASSGLSGLVGFLGGKMSSSPTTPSGAIAVENTNTTNNPVNTHETP